jgi:thiamine-phosphate pyrophosphorylase
MSVNSSRQQRLEGLVAARLYAITPEAEPAATDRVVAAWLRAGVPLVQLRQKRLPRGRLLELACRLAAACHEAGALLVVNDYVDVALLSGADGAHVGPDDLTVAAARAVAGPDLLVGASASSPEAGREAERDGADYLGSGPAYATPLKTEKRVIGPAGVAAVSAAVAVPVFAIGGVERARLPELRAAGVTRVCAIRALGEAADPEAEARAWLDELTSPSPPAEEGRGGGAGRAGVDDT